MVHHLGFAIASIKALDRGIEVQEMTASHTYNITDLGVVWVARFETQGDAMSGLCMLLQLFDRLALINVVLAMVTVSDLRV